MAIPVADLRREPLPPGLTLERDLLEESQLLYGDPVEVLEEQAGWIRILAVGQTRWVNNQEWRGYPGWVEKSALLLGPTDWKPNLVVRAKSGRVLALPESSAPLKLTLSLGTRLVGIVRISPLGQPNTPWWQIQLLDGSTGWILAHEVDFIQPTPVGPEALGALRAELVQTARLFIGDPYYWGGRSAHLAGQSGPPQTAVDCSGLTGLTYQAHNILIPRDAHDQWIKARPIPKESLQPGDLVFLHDPADPSRVSHVMLYAGEGRLIEGPGTGKVVREIGLEERLALEPDRAVSFGSFLS